MSSLLKMGDQNKSLKRSNGTLYHEIGNEEAEKIPELEFIWYILKWSPSRMQQSIPITVNIRNCPSSMDTIRAVPYIFIKKEKRTVYSLLTWKLKRQKRSSLSQLRLPLSFSFSFSNTMVHTQPPSPSATVAECRVSTAQTPQLTTLGVRLASRHGLTSTQMTLGSNSLLLFYIFFFCFKFSYFILYIN